MDTLTSADKWFAPLSHQERRELSQMFHDADKLLAAADALVPPDAGPMFGTWCIADTDLAMMLQRLLASADPVPDRLAAYARAQWARPSVAAWRALPRPAATSS